MQGRSCCGNHVFLLLACVWVVGFSAANFDQNPSPATTTIPISLASRVSTTIPSLLASKMMDTEMMAMGR